MVYQSSMEIPKFLSLVAERVRQLVAEGRAVHVTDQTARDLDLLAALPWHSASLVDRQVLPGSAFTQVLADMATCDLSLGWLLASKAETEVMCASPECFAEGASVDAVKGAAERAELALVSMTVNIHHDGTPLAAPYRGTREGARAAWEFMVNELRRMTPPRGFPGTGQQRTHDVYLRELTERYRGELEAMR